MICLVTGPVSAQNFSGHNWYFGNNNQAIRFNPGTNLPTVINPKSPLGTGGSAVATDQINGDLLFYTSGGQVFDATNAVMPGGVLTGSTTQNQPAVIAKVPGQENQYYIFYRTAAGTVLAATVNMKAPGNAGPSAPPLGAVTATAIPIPGLTGRSEAMITIPHNNGEEFWLVTHAAGTAEYTVTLIDVLATFPGTATTFTGGLTTNAANFSYHEGTGKIATSPDEIQRTVEIMNFFNDTGIITFFATVINSGVPTVASGEGIYDTEWSNSGDFLYISRHGEAGVQADVFQYQVSNSTRAIVSVLPQPNTIFRSYGLQMGPDSLIYHLYESPAGTFRLGTLANTDTLAAAVVYTPQKFTGFTNAKQFSSFAPADTIGINLDFTFAGTCQNAPTSFFPVVKPGADSLVWNFGDGSPPVSDWSPIYTYPNDGAFPATVIAFLNGQPSLPVTKTVTIAPFDLQINLVSDTTACSCELPISHAQNPLPPPPDCKRPFTVTAEITGNPTSIKWFGPAGLLADQTTATLTPQEAGFYYLIVTDGSGCSTYASVTIKEYGVPQQNGNVWHFGNRAGIDFNPIFDVPPGALQAITGPLNPAPEGCAVICDNNGQVIFSSDGVNIFDRTGTNITPAPNPPGLGGNTGSTQSVLIAPVPGDETLYYIFTTQEIYGTGTYELRYSLFDIKLDTDGDGIPNGGIVPLQYNKLLFSKSTERITFTGRWVIAHEYGNNLFRAYEISPQGIGNPVITGIGSEHSTTSPESGQGYMEFGGDNQLAVALAKPGANFIEVFDFVDSTGVVTNFHPVNLKEPTGQVYGIEFSAGKIFATVKTPTSTKIVEVFFDVDGVPHKVRPVAPITVAEELGSIQTGPDGQVYVAIRGKGFLGTIQPNSDTLNVSIYTNNAVPLLAGTTSLLGLPNPSTPPGNQPQGPALAIGNTCEDGDVTFTGTPTDPIDTFDWTIRDAANRIVTRNDSASFTHTFPDPGTYTATLILKNRCGLNRTLTQSFQIFAKPADPNFLPPGGQPVICGTSLTLEAQPAGAPASNTYLWSTGETTRTINVTRQGEYSVTVTNANGCTSDGSLVVADNRPIVTLPQNPVICQGEDFGFLDAQNPVTGTTYVWTINGAPAGTDRRQPVVTTIASPPTFLYQVTVTSPGGPGIGCSATASTTITINPTPTFSVLSANTTSCGANDGSLTIDFLTPANTRFAYDILGPTPSSGSDQTSATPPVVATPLAPGSYTINVRDQVGQCAATATAAIADNAFTINSVIRQNACNPVNLIVEHTATLAFTYQVFDSGTGALVASGTEPAPAASPSSFTIPGVNEGTYRITIVSGGCSFTSTPQTVAQDPVSTITGFTTDGCTVPITITVNGAAGGSIFVWTGPNIDGGDGTASITARPPQGPQTYNLNITEPGACPLDAPVTVDVNNDVIPDFTIPDACLNQVSLVASPTGPYTYRWYTVVAGTPTPIPGGQQIIAGIADNGKTYRLEVVNGVSGCVFTAEKQIAVSGPVDVTVAVPVPFPCEGTPFNLTANVTQAGIPSGATFQWFKNGASLPTTGPTLAVNDGVGGDFRVIATTPSQCSDEFIIPITPAPADPGLLFDEAVICPFPANPNPATRQVLLDAGPNFTSYEWFKDNDPTVIETTQTYTATAEGVYRVEMVNSFDCTSTDQTTVSIECDPKIVAPTAFRPASGYRDGEGEFSNREFRVLTFFIDDDGFEVHIFNRWGEMVYQSTDIDFRWNGGYNNIGELLPAGTYSYVVKYKSQYRPQDGVKEKRGGVVLVR